MAKGFENISKELLELLNDQYNREFASSALYLEYAGILHGMGFYNFSNIMKKWSQEEYGHAQLFYNFFISRNVRPKINKLISPVVTATTDIKEIMSLIWEYEKGVSDRMQEIAALCHQKKDYVTYQFISGLITEQIEEEDKCRKFSNALKLTDDLLEFDNQLSQIQLLEV